MKKIMVLLVLLFVGTKLCGKPVALENCLNTYMLNAFIQLAYQIDPFINVLSKPQDLYKEYTLGYAFQHLVWDIIKAQENNQSIECEFQGKSTNLQKFTTAVYTHMHFSGERIGDVYFTSREIMEQFRRTSSQDLISILEVSTEQTINVPGYSISTKKILGTPFFMLGNMTGNIANDIREFFDPKEASDYFIEPGTGTRYEKFYTLRFLSVPKFLIFINSSADEISNFPDELNLTQYIKGYSQALYQLRAITVYKSVGALGLFTAVVRDRDGKLYICNNSDIKQINNWQEESLGNHNLLLYVLKTSTNAVGNLVDKLIKLQQSLNNLKLVLTK